MVVMVKQSAITWAVRIRETSEVKVWVMILADSGCWEPYSIKWISILNLSCDISIEHVDGIDMTICTFARSIDIGAARVRPHLEAPPYTFFHGCLLNSRSWVRILRCKYLRRASPVQWIGFFSSRAHRTQKSSQVKISPSQNVPAAARAVVWWYRLCLFQTPRFRI